MEGKKSERKKSGGGEETRVERTKVQGNTSTNTYVPFYECMSV